MADRFEQWSRARLGEYVTRDGETWATIVVPVDDAQHDPRWDVVAAITPLKASHKPNPSGLEPLSDGVSLDEVKVYRTYLDNWIATQESGTIGETDRQVMRDLAPSDEAEKPPTTRHRKTRGK
jgi:hypothetical protein